MKAETLHQVLGAHLLPTFGPVVMDAATIRVLLVEFDELTADRARLATIAEQRLQMLGHGQTQLEATRTAARTLFDDLVDTHMALVAVIAPDAHPATFLEAAGVAQRIGRTFGATP